MKSKSCARSCVWCSIFMNKFQAQLDGSWLVIALHFTSCDHLQGRLSTVPSPSAFLCLGSLGPRAQVPPKYAHLTHELLSRSVSIIYFDQRRFIDIAVSGVPIHMWLRKTTPETIPWIYSEQCIGAATCGVAGKKKKELFSQATKWCLSSLHVRLALPVPGSTANEVLWERLDC